MLEGVERSWLDIFMGRANAGPAVDRRLIDVKVGVLWRECRRSWVKEMHAHLHVEESDWLLCSWLTSLFPVAGSAHY